MRACDGTGKAHQRAATDLAAARMGSELHTLSIDMVVGVLGLCSAAECRPQATAFLGVTARSRLVVGLQYSRCQARGCPRGRKGSHRSTVRD